MTGGEVMDILTYRGNYVNVLQTAQNLGRAEDIVFTKPS